MKIGLVKFPVLILISFFISSCSSDDKKITPEERLMIDTMSTNEIVRQRVIWDRACELKMDSMVKFAVDSLTNVTLKKIDQKIKAYQ